MFFLARNSNGERILHERELLEVWKIHFMNVLLMAMCPMMPAQLYWTSENVLSVHSMRVL